MTYQSQTRLAPDHESKGNDPLKKKSHPTFLALKLSHCSFRAPHFLVLHFARGQEGIFVVRSESHRVTVTPLRLLYSGRVDIVGDLSVLGTC